MTNVTSGTNGSRVVPKVSPLVSADIPSTECRSLSQARAVVLDASVVDKAVIPCVHVPRPHREKAIQEMATLRPCGGRSIPAVPRPGITSTG
jgi:hypothetical protein